MKRTIQSALLVTAGVMITMQSSFAYKKYPEIYPFVPETTEKIYSDVENVSEDKNFIRNFNDIIRKRLSKSKTKVQPWTSSYWPLSKGTIADPYEDTGLLYYLQPSWVRWIGNYNSFQRRKYKVHAKIDQLNEEELEKLAPSEKYDLLLGDKSFDLTNRLMEYMRKWGQRKEFGFLLGDPALIGENALDIAMNEINQFGWHRDIDHAFTNSVRLNGSLSVEYANALVNAGKYESVVDAFPEAVQMAKDEANNYVLEKKSSMLAAWEGICNGWSTAAGIVPRPRKAISFKLPDGRNLKFYPADIQGLISLFWVNSTIQDYANKDKHGKVTYGGTISAGLRCNRKNSKLDEWGRLYDDAPDPFAGTHDARCVGVHPATWHLGLVNIIGKQKRSFVVERKVDEAVDNHPMHSYKMRYFNPNNGNFYKEMGKTIVRIDSKDQFRKFRNPKARYIVGVETTMTYLNYAKPKRRETNSEEDDEKDDKLMYYDLELDENFNIVGGQWRATEVGAINDFWDAEEDEEGNYNQPDFFWVITKQWKDSGIFDDEKDLSRWVNRNAAPPRDWIKKAKEFHAFEYKNTYEFGTGQKCRMKNRRTGRWRKVSCEFSYNKPQPLINVLNTLIERSK